MACFKIYEQPNCHEVNGFPEKREYSSAALKKDLKK